MTTEARRAFLWVLYGFPVLGGAGGVCLAVWARIRGVSVDLPRGAVGLVVLQYVGLLGGIWLASRCDVARVKRGSPLAGSDTMYHVAAMGDDSVLHRKQDDAGCTGRHEDTGAR